MVEATLAAIKYNLSFFSKGLLIFFLILSVLAPSYVLWVLYPQKNLLPLPDNSAEEPVSTNHGSFRDGLMMDILKDHPGLTYEELDKQMSEFGF